MPPSVPIRTPGARLKSSVKDGSRSLSASKSNTSSSSRTHDDIHMSKSRKQTRVRSDGQIIRRKRRSLLPDEDGVGSVSTSASATAMAKSALDNDDEQQQITTSAGAGSDNYNNINSMNSMGGGYGMGGMGGMNMMGMGMGMGMSPYSMGGMGMGMGGMGMGGYGGMGGPLSSINQFLFSFQSIIFSLGQAMQVVGMNTQAMEQLYQQAMHMMDTALVTMQDLKSLECKDLSLLSEEEQKKRRRLKALRWGLMMGVSYVGVKVVMKWWRRRREYQLQMMKRRRLMTSGGGSGSSAYPNPSSSNAYNSSYTQSSQMQLYPQQQSQQYGTNNYNSGYNPQGSHAHGSGIGGGYSSYPSNLSGQMYGFSPGNGSSNGFDATYGAGYY